MIKRYLFSQAWHKICQCGGKRLRLKDLVDVLDGQRRPISATERNKIRGDIPYWGANGIVDRVNDSIFEGELVLLGEDGAPFLDQGKDVAFYVNEPVWVNNHIHVLRPHSVDARFLVHALNVLDYSKYIDFSTRDKLTSGSMLNIELCVPSLSEQTMIVEELRLLRESLPNPRPALDALDAWHQSAVWHIVTGGEIGNNARWNSNVPTTWRRCRVDQLARIESGYPFRAEMLKLNGRYPVLRQGDVEAGRTELFTDEETNAPKIQRGDFLICQSGDFKLTEWLGGIAYLNQRVALLHDVHPLLRYVLPFSLQELQDTTNPTTIQNLSIDDLRKLVIFLPPNEAAIVTQLDSLSERYNRQRAILEELTA